MANEHQSDHKLRPWRNFLAHEAFEYLFNFIFLAVFLVAFAWYRRLILAAYGIHYLNYWMPLIEAAILAKVIMLGDALRVGRRFRDKPLAFTTLYPMYRDGHSMDRHPSQTLGIVGKLSLDKS